MNEIRIDWSNEVVILKNCKAEWYNKGINIYNMDEVYLGSICGDNPNEDWELIKAGHDPIEEGWEDGAGHTCTLDGWKDDE